MKKTIFVLALAAVMLMTGCSSNEGNENYSLKDSDGTSSSSKGLPGLDISADTGEEGTSMSTTSYSDMIEGLNISADTTTEWVMNTEQFKKDIFTVGAEKCGDWYYREDYSGAVLYVDDYSKIEDKDKFIEEVYEGLNAVSIQMNKYGEHSAYLILKENGTIVASTTDIGGDRMSVIWVEEYGAFNDNELAKQLDEDWRNSSPSL